VLNAQKNKGLTLARKGKDFVSKKNKENWLSVRRPKKKGLITFAQKGEAFISKKKKWLSAKQPKTKD
jgi:hypothetical protein